MRIAIVDDDIRMYECLQTYFENCSVHLPNLHISKAERIFCGLGSPMLLS